MSSGVLPTTRHAKELIEHAEEHLLSGSERDMKISLLHADNSIEILLKEHLRYGREKSWEEIERMSFYKLLSSCKDISLVRSSKSFFLAFHDMRNAVYHVGTLVPMKKDVESAVEFSKTLFNELHPQSKFAEARIELPSEKSIHEVSDTLGFQPYITELSLVREFSEYMRENGYDVSIEHKTNEIRADLFAVKEASGIVCEFKIKRSVGVDSVHQTKSYVGIFREAFPDKNIEGWLITNGIFSEAARRVAKRFDIQLFDGERLKELLHKKTKGASGRS